MKYSEAEKQIKSLSSKYNVYADSFDDCFNVNYKRIGIAFVNNDTRYKVNVWSSEYFSKLPFSNKLYMILSELAITPLEEREDKKKQYVKVFNSRVGYLNINNFTGKMSISDVFEVNGIKTKFTDKEIEQLKQRDDISLDWNEVYFEEAE